MPKIVSDLECAFKLYEKGRFLYAKFMIVNAKILSVGNKKNLLRQIGASIKLFSSIISGIPNGYGDS